MSLATYTKQELLNKLKKQRRMFLVQSVLLLLMVVFAVFSFIDKGISFQTFLPLFFAPMLFVMLFEVKKIKKEDFKKYIMNKEKIITATIAFVKKELKNAEGGHDWFHIERVFKNTLLISKDEKVAIFVVSLAALLHDIADPKFYNGDETIGPKIAKKFLEEQKVDTVIITHVINIIKHISFKNSFDKLRRNGILKN